MPVFTLVFNILSLFCLVTGYFFIKRKDVTKHKLFMLLAFLCSIILLILFLEHRYSHGFVLSKEALNNHFGPMVKYFLIFLVSHIIAAITSAILSVPTIYWGLSKQWVKHKKIAPWTFWIWVYSSVTGVMLYVLMLGLIS
jgi:putative membrane protein